MNLSKTKLQLYSNLATAKMRRKRGLFIVEGCKSVADSWRAFDVEAILRTEGSDFSIEGCRAPIFTLCEEDMRRVSNLATRQEAIGLFRIPSDDGQESAIVSDDGLYLLLDGVQDPGNLGTIIRTCHWFGITTIFASRDTVDIYNPKTVQATMGSLGKVRILYRDLEEIIASNPGVPVYGTLLEGESLYRVHPDRRGFIVMGNEGNGISENIRKLVDNPVTIPPYGHDHGESLNVAVATAITVAWFRKTDM